MHLREWRTKKQMPITEAAKLFKAEPSLLSKWERGLCRPSLEAAVRILEGTSYEVTLLDLATFGPERKKRGSGKAS